LRKWNLRLDWFRLQIQARWYRCCMERCRRGKNAWFYFNLSGPAGYRFPRNCLRTRWRLAEEWLPIFEFRLLPYFYQTMWVRPSGGLGSTLLIAWAVHWLRVRSRCVKIPVNRWRTSPFQAESFMIPLLQGFVGVGLSARSCSTFSSICNPEMAKRRLIEHALDQADRSLR